MLGGAVRAAMLRRGCLCHGGMARTGAGVVPAGLLRAQPLARRALFLVPGRHCSGGNRVPRGFGNFKKGAKGKKAGKKLKAAKNALSMAGLLKKKK